MSPLLAQIVKDGTPVRLDPFSKEIQKSFPSRDLHRSQDSLHRVLATNIYKTKDGRFYHVHGKTEPPSTHLRTNFHVYSRREWGSPR